LNQWFRRWGARIGEQLKDLPPEGKRATRLRTRLEEMEKYLHDREENWKNTHLRATDEPTTRLVLAIEGARQAEASGARRSKGLSPMRDAAEPVSGLCQAARKVRSCLWVRQ
jgi:hypothetical protein